MWLFLPSTCCPFALEAEASTSDSSRAAAVRRSSESSARVSAAAVACACQAAVGTSKSSRVDNAWAMHLLALQRALPATSYASLTDALPMLRTLENDLRDQPERNVIRRRRYLGRGDLELIGMHPHRVIVTPGRSLGHRVCRLRPAVARKTPS